MGQNIQEHLSNAHKDRHLLKVLCSSGTNFAKKNKTSKWAPKLGSDYAR